MINLCVTCSVELETVDFLDLLCEKTLKQVDFYAHRRLGFAVHEVIINAVEANRRKFGPENIGKTITLQIKVQKDEAEILVIDEAGGISTEDWDDTSQRTFEEVLWSENGRGLLLIKSFVNEVWHEYGINNTVGLRMKEER